MHVEIGLPCSLINNSIAVCRSNRNKANDATVSLYSYLKEQSLDLENTKQLFSLEKFNSFSVK